MRQSIKMDEPNIFDFYNSDRTRRSKLAELIIEVYCGLKRAKQFIKDENIPIKIRQKNNKYVRHGDLYDYDFTKNELKVFDVKSSFPWNKNNLIYDNQAKSFKILESNGVETYIIYFIFEQNWNAIFWFERFDISKMKVMEGWDI